MANSKCEANDDYEGINFPIPFFRLFGFIIKKLSGEYMGHIFSEFDANNTAPLVTAQINSLLLNK